MITSEQCKAFAGLAPNEIVLGADRSKRHSSLLSSYLFNLKRGPEALRELIVSDIRASIDIGAEKLAADLLIVLQDYLSDYPEARLVQQRARTPNGGVYGAQ